MDQFQGGGSWLEKNKNAVYIGGFFVVLLLVIVIIFAAMNMVNQSRRQKALEEAAKEPAAAPAEPAATSTEPIGLPGAGDTTNPSGNGNGNGEEWEAEKISFGDFYKSVQDDFTPSIADYSLPLNVKVDVSNYHDVSRKINLDAAIGNLNENGFAVIDNPFPSEADEFFKMYSLLDSKQVPTLVTDDFLYYYYQNSLKMIFKDIERTVFYENLWQTNKKLYALAKERYEKNLENKEKVSQIALEGSRLEAAYFATALSLLSPTEKQIVKEAGLQKINGFSVSEANEFSFSLPAYLKDDVSREVELIRAAKEPAKSPVLLYERDYKQFAVPAAYSNDARLNNFYLASRWLNSVFPLYYKSDSCPECLLDMDDWRINMYAAFLVSGDLSGQQELQNRWAKIYKIKSFFQGLRGDLNYLHYVQAFADEYGNELSVEEALGSSDGVDEKLAKLQEKLGAIEFAAIEGGLSKTGTSTRPYLGLKMLSEPYWPNSYIFGELTYPKTGLFLGGEKEAERVPTACSFEDKKKNYRCFGIGFDVVNLVHDLGAQGEGYFATNTRYELYPEQRDKLRNELGNFTVMSWHNNIYWANLDTVQKFLAAPEEERPSFMKSSAWRKKDLTVAVSSWVNLQLPADTFVPYQEGSAARLNQLNEDSQAASFRYIEPNLSLIKDLAANTKMIFEMLTLLKVSDQENTVLFDLKNLQKDFDALEKTAKKELSGEALTDDDHKFIGELTRRFLVKEKGSRTIEFAGKKGQMVEKLENVRLLVLAYRLGDKKIFAVGPVFNYWETRKK